MEKIIERIEKDVENKIESIMQEEKKKAKKIKKEIEQEKEKRLDELRKEKEREISTMKNRIISQAELESRKKKLTIREEMIERVFERVRERLKELDASEYEDYLRESVERAESVLQGKITIHCDTEQKEFIEQIVNERDDSMELKDDIETLGGIKATSDRGTTINMTFEANLERKKKDLRKEISDILFPEEG